MECFRSRKLAHPERFGHAFQRSTGSIRPNGRFVAFASDDSGRFEVFVRSFPEADDQKRVSIAGGMQPEWRRDGRELFYISPERKLMAVPVTADKGPFDFGTARALFDVDLPEVSAPYPTEYAVTADGQRFLVNTVVEQTSRPALTVVLNWHEELRARTRSN